MEAKDLKDMMAAIGVRGVALEIPRNATEAQIDQALSDAIHEAGLCECQEDDNRVDKVRELRSPKNNELRKSLSTKVAGMHADLMAMERIYNGLIDTIKILDEDPDPEDKAACSAHDMKVTIQMLKLVQSVFKRD